MNFQNDKYTLRLADESDSEGIREIFESGGFEGGISVQYLRNPSPIASFEQDGDYARIIVAVDNVQGRIAAVGGAVVRREYLNGNPEKCAYLTGLKIHPDYRRKMYFFAEAYRFLYEKISDCRFFYTTILDDNLPAIRLLEKHHKGMPRYRFLGHYTTYCFHGGRRCLHGVLSKIFPERFSRNLQVEKNNTEGFDELMETFFSRRSLTPIDYRCSGFGRTTFYCVRENGEIAACCFVGNQQAHKQYKMCAYQGVYRFLSHIPTGLFGYPDFPKAGTEIHYGTVSYLYIKDNDPKLCRNFLRSVAEEAGFSLLLWGGFENNPLCEALGAMKTVHYGSRLYSVEWGDVGNAPGTDDCPSVERGDAARERMTDVSEILGVEVALL